MYQTLPNLSSAKKSKVSSMICPPTEAVSLTTTQSTPRIFLVSWVTAELIMLALVLRRFVNESRARNQGKIPVANRGRVGKVLGIKYWSEHRWTDGRRLKKRHNR